MKKTINNKIKISIIAASCILLNTFILASDTFKPFEVESYTDKKVKIVPKNSLVPQPNEDANEKSLFNASGFGGEDNKDEKPAKIQVNTIDKEEKDLDQFSEKEDKSDITIDKAVQENKEKEIALQKQEKEKVAKAKEDAEKALIDYKERKEKLENYMTYKKYEKTVKKLFIGKEKLFETLTIPVGQHITIKFDKNIKKVEYIPDPESKIEWRKEETPNILELENQNPLLDITLKIQFIDDQEVNLQITGGEKDSQRFIEYKIYTDNKSNDSLKIFAKKLKIEDLRTYFNDISTTLILDYLTKGKNYDAIVSNIVKVNKPIGEKLMYEYILPNGESKKLPYTLYLKHFYDTPFVEEDRESSQSNSSNPKTKKIVMLFIKIKNESKDQALVISENFIKQRFSNFISFYVGDIENNEHIVGPNSTKDIIINIESEQKDI
jgi:hypothetical protein